MRFWNWFFDKEWSMYVVIAAWCVCIGLGAWFLHTVLFTNEDLEVSITTMTKKEFYGALFLAVCAVLVFQNKCSCK